MAHSLTVVNESLTGNAVSCAWSRGSLGAVLMREGFRGALRAHVVDSTDGFRIVSSFPVPNPSKSGYARLAFPEGEDDVLVASDGFVTTRWNASTGTRIAEWTHVAAGSRDHASILGFASDGRPLLSRVHRGDTVRTDVCAVDLATGEIAVVIPKSVGELVVPLEDDFLLAARDLSRVARGGKVLWRVDPPVPGFGPRHLVVKESLILVVEMSGLVHAHDAATGALLGKYEMGDVMDAGIANGRPWVLLRGGELRWIEAATGAKTAGVALDPRAMRIAIADDGVRALVLLELMDFRSSVQAVSLLDGKVAIESGPSFAPSDVAVGGGALFVAGHGGVLRLGAEDGSLARVHGKASSAVSVAKTNGTVVFASAGRAFVVDPPHSEKARPLGYVRGDVMLAVSDDGARVAVLDDDSLRIFDARSKKLVMTADRRRIERTTIDPPDGVGVDAAGDAWVIVGPHRYVVSNEEARPLDGESRTVLGARRVGIEDGAVALHDHVGIVIGRIHFAADGKAGLVEDGARIDLLGAVAKARSLRTIRVDGVPATGKAIDRLREQGLLSTLLRGIV